MDVRIVPRTLARLVYVYEALPGANHDPGELVVYQSQAFGLDTSLMQVQAKGMTLLHLDALKVLFPNRVFWRWGR